MITIPRKIREVRLAGVDANEVLYKMTEDEYYRLQKTADELFDCYLVTKDKKTFSPMFKALTVCKNYPTGVDFDEFVDACYLSINQSK